MTVAAASNAQVFVAGVWSRALLREMDASGRRYNVGRSRNGVLHITAALPMQFGRIKRTEGQRLCRKRSVREDGLRWIEEPTCEACLIIAERISTRQMIERSKN